MRNVVNSKRWWMGVFILALAVIPAIAQVDIGSISGTVVDTSDAVVPSVRIIVRNEGNRTTQEATTNSSGYYIFPSLMEIGRASCRERGWSAEEDVALE